MKRLMLLKALCIVFFMAVIFVFTSGPAYAIPSSQAIYWKYDYILHNTSDPLADAGYNIYDFTLYFDTAVTLSTILPLSDWDFISDSSSFIDWYSILPGEPPLGADIAPGTSLNGFSFTSNMQLASLSFDVYFTNPRDLSNPNSLRRQHSRRS